MQLGNYVERNVKLRDSSERFMFFMRKRNSQSLREVDERASP
jgi:hypothetical protein